MRYCYGTYYLLIFKYGLESRLGSRLKYGLDL